MDYKRRVIELKNAVESSRTKKSRAWRARIYNRIIGYIKSSAGDDTVFKKSLWGDYLAWSAWWFNGETAPLFLTTKQYQMYVEFMQSDENIWFYQRRAGKSVGSAILVLYYSMTVMNQEVQVFAPTEDQLVLMHSIRRFLAQESATDLYNEFLGEDVIKSKGGNDGDEELSKLGAVFNQKYIRFLNGSSINATTLNVKGGGASKRGFSANLIVGDEFQDIPASIREEIIDPIIMDSFSDNKRLVYIGTPHRKVDPKLDLMWEAAKASKTVGTLHSHCWEAVEEGVRLPKIMAGRFGKLGIPCKWVLEHGVCPIYLPDMYEEVSGEVVERAADGKGMVPCGKVCMDNMTFVQEDMAEFAAVETLGIQPEWLRAAARNYTWTEPSDANIALKDDKVVMSIDYGDVHADTHICIWKLEHYNDGILSGNRLRMVHNEIVKDLNEIGVANPSVDIIKKRYWQFSPDRIFIDATSKKEEVTRLITGSSPIPRHLFYTNESAKKNGTVGVWFNGPLKAEMFNNMREQFRLNRLIVPGFDNDMVFWNQFYDELTELQPQEPTQTRPYTLWGSTLHMTDAIALGAMYLKDDLMVPAYTEVAFIPMGDFGREDDEDY